MTPTNVAGHCGPLSPQPSPVAQDAGEGRHRLWEEVFSRSRVVHVDAAQGVALAAPVAAGPAQVLSPMTAGYGASEAVALPSEEGAHSALLDAASAAGLPGQGTQAKAAIALPRTAAGIEGNPRAPATAAAPSSPPQPDSAGVGSAPLKAWAEPTVRDRIGHIPVRRRAEPAPPADDGRDSVHVVRHGDTLSIVIRDPLLDDATALRCALEAAHQLTGDARRLRQLTLNGRSLLDLPLTDPPAAPELPSFRC
jgi:hypothetical protein